MPLSSTFQVRFENATLSGNEAFRDGGAIAALNTDGTVIVNASTITNNFASTADERVNVSGAEGGGIFVGNNSSVLLENTIVSGNVNAQSGASVDLFGAFNSSGQNLIGINDGAVMSFAEGFPNGNGDFVGTSAVPISASLGPLQDNGGVTQTHALLQFSPARDQADGATSPGTDQRGVVRPSGMGPDIGAFELDLSTADLSLTKTVDNPQAGMNDTVVFTISVRNDGPGDATSVTVTDAEPAGITFDSSTPSQGMFTAPTWNIGPLTVGETATLTINATITTTNSVAILQKSRVLWRQRSGLYAGQQRSDGRRSGDCGHRIGRPKPESHR